jgi:NADH-quinone oxidoreductase subunit H
VCAKVDMTASSVDIALFAVKVGLVFFVILTLAAYLVFAERRILAWVQDRKGPNRVGPFGLCNPWQT